MKLKSGIYFTNNTISNKLGEFSLITPSIFFEVQDNNLIYSKGKLKTKGLLFWSLSVKNNEPLGDSLEISIQQNNQIINKYTLNIHEKEEIFGDELEIQLELKDQISIQLENQENKNFLINSGFLVINI